MHALEQRIDCGAAFTLDGFGHEGCGGGGDGAALTLKLHVLDPVTIQPDRHRQAVAAERIVTIGFGIGGTEPSEVSGFAVVIEDHIAIQILEVHQAKTSRTRSTAATRRVTSSAVL